MDIYVEKRWRVFWSLFPPNLLAKALDQLADATTFIEATTMAIDSTAAVRRGVRRMKGGGAAVVKRALRDWPTTVRVLERREETAGVRGETTAAGKKSRRE
ncbi:hypothetical protein Syun_003887 [Stephania yunnanensis]|uniref:Uncharacterized protein n=1 Tax=Stephania yunnanensis TaxID=152371 RepID=A0AAP0Q0Z4_9MAGN